jgi:membrane protein required for colicin V production
MTIDLVLACVLLGAGLLGALQGAARQVAYWLALGVAYFTCRPLTHVLAPKVAASFHLPRLMATLALSIVTFILVLVAARYVLTVVLRSLFRGTGDDERAGPDRLFGFVLGALEAGAILYFVLSALCFVEDRVTVAGQSVGLSPKDSYVFGLARRYNLFELTEFAPARHLASVVEALHQPERAKKLEKDPAVRALMADTRFRHALDLPKLSQKCLAGDCSALLKESAVVDLISDPTSTARLNAAAHQTEE